jgi:hypothetical protein
LAIGTTLPLECNLTHNAAKSRVIVKQKNPPP